MIDYNKILVKNILFLRKQGKISQETLVFKIFDVSGKELTRSAYGSYEEYRCRMDMNTIVALSKIFNQSIDDLLTKDLTNKPNNQ